MQPNIASTRTTLAGDDVVFMYPAAEPAVYVEYGCTFLAWGGAKAGEVVRQLESLGVHSTGSMWCLTAGSEDLHKNPDLRDAVCRDINLQPIPVWWLFDRGFEGTPTWFGCTNHPAFRAHIRMRAAEEMRGGASGLHVDDHLGTAHTVAFLGGCFCDHCMIAFGRWLERNATAETLLAAGVSNWIDFDYRTLVRKYATDDTAYREQAESIPLRSEFLDCQLQLAAENVRQLGALAAEIVQRPITLSANSALPELPHLAVTPYLTHLVGEVPHHAEMGTANLLDAVHAYRMAEAIGKPIAATARGQDWAWVKKTGSVNLVKIWIALSYCMGQRLMAPHRQWCFTLDLGGHWYEAPPGEFSPLYRFVREHPELFRETTTLGPLVPPSNVPKSFGTTANRARLQAMLSEGNPQPIRTGNVWIFPRRAADGSLVIHVLNLEYLAYGDYIAPQRNFEIVVPQTNRNAAMAGTVFAYDAEPFQLEVRRPNDVISLKLPELRIWASIVIS